MLVALGCRSASTGAVTMELAALEREFLRRLMQALGRVRLCSTIASSLAWSKLAIFRRPPRLLRATLATD
jgi:hypothetical protein